MFIPALLPIQLLVCEIELICIAADPSKRAKPKDDDDDDDDDEAVPALVDATPKKALPSPRERKSTRGSGTVPPVPRKKDD